MASYLTHCMLSSCSTTLSCTLSQDYISRVRGVTLSHLCTENMDTLSVLIVVVVMVVACYPKIILDNLASNNNHKVDKPHKVCYS